MNSTLSTQKTEPRPVSHPPGEPAWLRPSASRIAAYQLALALGAPFGGAAWGGTHPGTLPPGFASAVGALLWGPRGSDVLQRVELSSILPFARTFVRRATWVLVVLSFMSAVANFASQSAAERFILAPVALALGVLRLIVARRPSADPGQP